MSTCYLAMPPTAMVAWSHVWPLVTHSVPTLDVVLLQNMFRFLQNAYLPILWFAKIPRRCWSMMFVIIPWFSACRTLWSCWTDQSGKPRTLSQGRSQGSPERCFEKILFASFSLFDYFSLFDCSLTSSHSAWSSLPLVLNSMPPQLMTPSKDLFMVFQQGHIHHFQFSRLYLPAVSM